MPDLSTLSEIGLNKWRTAIGSTVSGVLLFLSSILWSDEREGMLLMISLVELDEQHLSCLLSFWSVGILLGQHKSCVHLYRTTTGTMLMTQIDRWSWRSLPDLHCSGLNWFEWLIRCNRKHHFIISVWLCSLPWPCFQLGSLASLLQIESWLQLTSFVFIDMTCLHSSSSCYLCQHLVNWQQIFFFSRLLCFVRTR